MYISFYLVSTETAVMQYRIVSLASLLQFFKKDFIYLFQRGKGREKERERNIDVWLPLTCPLLGIWPATQACALTGNQSGDPLIHRRALNPLRHTYQGPIILFDLLICFLHFSLSSVCEKHLFWYTYLYKLPSFSQLFCFQFPECKKPGHPICQNCLENRSHEVLREDSSL